MITTLTQLINNMNTCATVAGFNTFKFGKLAHINFDHNIEYDLLNVQYPDSRIFDFNTAKQVYTFRITAARPTSKANLTGVQLLNNIHLIMTSLEKRIWNFLACVGAGSNCQDVIPADTISISRDVGTHNDNLVTLDCTFNVEVFSACIEIDCDNVTDPWPPEETKETWNCIKGLCIDPGDGSGTYITLTDCQLSEDCKKDEDDVFGADDEELKALDEEKGVTPVS